MPMYPNGTIIPMCSSSGNMSGEYISANKAKKCSRVLKRNLQHDSGEYADAIRIVQKWRAQCAPAARQCFETLLECCEGIEGVVLTYRLKRIPSIIQKLQRPQNYDLSTLDDVGGCRVIVKKVEDLEIIKDRLEENIKTTGSIIRKSKDYIRFPKDTGYRSYHVLTKQHTAYGNYRVEVQLRTQLQHYWATALEVMDEIEGISVKTSDKDSLLKNPFTEGRLMFNQLTSSLLALREGTPLVAGVPTDKKSLIERVESLPDVRRIGAKLLNACDDVFKISKSYCDDEEASVFILRLLKEEQSLIVYSYAKAQIDRALADYAQFETKLSGSASNECSLSTENIVLVHVDNFRELKIAYPNYSANIFEYLQVLREEGVKI